MARVDDRPIIIENDSSKLCVTEPVTKPVERLLPTLKFASCLRRLASCIPDLRSIAAASRLVSFFGYRLRADGDYREPLQ